MKELITAYIDEYAVHILSQCPEKTFIDLPVLDLDILAFRDTEDHTNVFITKKESLNQEDTKK